MAAKCKEKLTLFHDTQAVVYCQDDELVNRCMSEFAYHGEQLAWSVKNNKAAFFVKLIEKKDVTTTVTYVYNGKTEGSYSIPFIDEASVTNSIVSAIAALYLGITTEQLAERMAKLEPVAMRLEVKEGQRGCTLINDSYNSDINSLDIALDFMSRRPDHKGRKRTLILSDIYQSGLTDEKLYHEVDDLCVQRGIKKFIGIGEHLQNNAAQFDNIDEKASSRASTSSSIVRNSVPSAMR